jgi:hypothetical protein
MAALVPNEAVVGLAQALLAWADQHGPDSHGAVGLGAPPTVDRIFSLLARCPEDAVSVAESLAERGDVPLWRFHGWHLVLPEGLRRGVLLRAMRARSRIAAPGRWVGRLCELAKELPVAERAPLLEIAVCISRLIPAEPTGDIAARQRELECLRDVAAVAPPAMQAVVVDELLARAPEDVDQRNWLLHGLVPHLGPELGARVARAMTEVPEGRRLGQSPCWLEAAARVFPEGEWERRLRALLAADAIDPGALHRPFLPPTLRAERRAQALAAAQTFEEHSRWLSWHFEDLDPSERRALLGEALERAATDLASGGDAAETADAALAYLIRVCQPADLAPHAARLVASAAMSVRTEALRLCAQRGDLAQAALYAPGVTDPLALLVYRIRTLESRESIEPLYREHTARVFSYGWVVELLADAGRIDEVAQLAQGGPAEDSSALAAACFPHATAAGQRELRDATLRAARSHPASSSYLWLLPHLSDDQVDELWARDGSAEGLGAFPVSYYRRFGPDALRVVCARAVAELSAALCT